MNEETGQTSRHREGPAGGRIARLDLVPLLELAERIAEHRTLPELFEGLATSLEAATGIDLVLLDLYDPVTDRLKLHVRGGSLPGNPALAEALARQPLDATPAGHVWQTQRTMILASTDPERTFPDFRAFVDREGAGWTAVGVPLTTARRKMGVIAFVKQKGSTLTEAETEVLEFVAKHVAVSVENALNQEQARSLGAQLAKERDELRLRLEVASVAATELGLGQLVRSIGAALARVLPHDWTDLALHDPVENVLRLHTLVPPPRGSSFLREGLEAPIPDSPPGRAFATRKPFVVNSTEEANRSPVAEDLRRAAIELGVQSYACIPLISRDRVLGTLSFGSTRAAAFPPSTVELLSQIAAQIAPAIDNALAYERLDALNARLASEKVYLQEEIWSEGRFGEIVGESEALRRTLNAVETVAATDSTVLITGETGTGKELIARAIHRLSPRNDKTFVKLNCAAIPTGLLESELFGHEKGAFTGAVSTKAGRFELAHKGSLFLDEIGEISQELQPKLLRVLQDQEFERLGGTKTIKVDVRLIAATNRNLGHMVAAREFRSDLFYRLNVFPIAVPPLRERRSDVPLLVRRFVEQFSRRMGKKISTIPAETMAALENHSWPGNVRELGNIIERSVILSRGPLLEVPLHELAAPAPPSVARPTGPAALDATPGGPLSAVEETERELITRALEDCGWRVGGPKGAAKKLGLSRTTLQSRMLRLGVNRPG